MLEVTNTRRIIIKKGGYTFTFIKVKDQKNSKKMKLKLISIECEKNLGDCYPPEHTYFLALRQGYAMLKRQLLRKNN